MDATTFILRKFRYTPLYLCFLIRLGLQVAFPVLGSRLLRGERGIMRRRDISSLTLMFKLRTCRRRVRRAQALSRRNLWRIMPTREGRLSLNFLRNFQRKQRNSSRYRRITFDVFCRQRRTRISRQRVRLCVLIGLSLHRLQVSMGEHVNFIGRVRSFLPMILLLSFTPLRLLGFRIMLLGGSFKSTRGLIQGLIKRTRFMFRPINFFLGTWLLRIFQVVKVVVSNNRHARLIRSFGRRSFNVRVHGSRQASGNFRAFFFSPLLCNFRRN